MVLNQVLPLGSDLRYCRAAWEHLVFIARPVSQSSQSMLDENPCSVIATHPTYQGPSNSTRESILRYYSST